MRDCSDVGAAVPCTPVVVQAARSYRSALHRTERIVKRWHKESCFFEAGRVMPCVLHGTRSARQRDQCVLDVDVSAAMSLRACSLGHPLRELLGFQEAAGVGTSTAAAKGLLPLLCWWCSYLIAPGVHKVLDGTRTLKPNQSLVFIWTSPYAFPLLLWL